jgi:FixJ family two-component response regulator
VSDKQVVAILDDDASIHYAWDRRLFDISKHLEIHHFYSTAEFIAWYPLQSEPIQVFSDYELLDDPLTGLDALEQVNCGENAILVTSHYETLELMERCQKRKIRLLPKNLLAHVLIQKVKGGGKRTERKVDLVLIDDNKNLRQGWRFAADHAGKNILTFASPAEFEALLPRPSFTTPIYIDSDLGCGIQGETYAKALFEKGFKEIYLVTGHPPSHFRFLPWIRAILSKTPPF